jgi:hypothetical protein
MQSYRFLESVLNLSGPGVKLDPADAGAVSLAREDSDRWKRALKARADNDPDVVFDVQVGMALSSVMLTEEANHLASSRACAVGRYYLAHAKEELPGLSKAPLELDDSKISRLKGYLLQIETRLGIACRRT